MNSDNESFTISSQETFLAAKMDQQQSSPPKINKNLKTILLALLLLFLLIVSSTMILSYIYKNIRRPKKPNSYESGSSRYYCHLTRYQQLCYDSLSSVINTTVLKSGPGPIFSASLRAAVNQLDRVSISIAKSTTSTTNGSLVGARMSDCRAWVHDSRRRLNESLSVLGVDPDVEALTFEEMDSVRAWSLAAKANAHKCYSGFMEEEMEGTEEKNGVEEVKMGVEKARKCMVNSIRLWDMRGTILDDFYNPYYPYDYYYDYYYYYYSYYNYDYRFMICLYSTLYIFIALLYFLFWRN